MPNKFQNIQEFGGVNLNAIGDNIPDTDATDCNSIDFSLDGVISVNSGKISIGGQRDTTSGDGTMFNFKKAFGTKKEILVRSVYKSGLIKLEWLNDYYFTSPTKIGQWELISTTSYNSSNFGYAIGNGDNNKQINRLFLGNAVDNMLIWNGATTNLVTSSTTSTTIATSSTNLLAEGFELNPYGLNNHVLINGSDFIYTGISGGTFTGVTPNPVTYIGAGTIKQGDGITNVINSTLMTQCFTQNYNIRFNFVGLTGNQIIRNDVGGSFLTDGYQLGQKIFVTGFTDTHNNGSFTIKAINSTTITFEDSEGITGSSEAIGNLITVSAGAPKGNVLQVDNGKLYIAGITGSENTFYYSVTNELTNFAITTDAKLTDGGFFTIYSGGKQITAIYPRGDNRIIVHKNDGIYSYNVTVNTSNIALASLDILSLGQGVGARNNNCITSYDKTIYYFNGANELKAMEQSVYSTSTFNFDTILDQFKSISILGSPYLTYDFTNQRLLLSYNSRKVSEVDLNYIASIFIKNSAQGKKYKVSIENISLDNSGTNLATALPMVYTNNGSFNISGLYVYIAQRSDTYVMSYGISQLTNSKPYWVSKEFTFGEPAQLKEFDIVNLDGYLYADTKLRVSVLYGTNGKDGVKHYVIDKDSINSNSENVVETDTVSEYNYELLGNNSLLKQYELSNFWNSNYFKLTLHLDTKKSDRYKIRIETYAPLAADIESTWWAINNISTNPTLKDVKYSDMCNQNEADGNGVGSDNVGHTNVGYGIS